MTGNDSPCVHVVRRNIHLDRPAKQLGATRRHGSQYRCHLGRTTTIRVNVDCENDVTNVASPVRPDRSGYRCQVTMPKMERMLHGPTEARGPLRVSSRPSAAEVTKFGEHLLTRLVLASASPAACSRKETARIDSQSVLSEP